MENIYRKYYFVQPLPCLHQFIYNKFQLNFRKLQINSHEIIICVLRNSKLNEYLFNSSEPNKNLA